MGLTLDDFKKQFAGTSNRLTLSHAALAVRKMRTDYPLLSKGWTFNRLEYNHRLALNTACMELEKALQNAAPWEDYREVIADYIWPYMRRILQHMNGGYYEGQYGEKWGMSDAWFAEMWFAYDKIFRRLAGTIPDTTVWKMMDCVINQAERCTRKYRRKL